MSNEINKRYVSDVDNFLLELWKTVPRTTSQCQEEAKAERIATLRDQVQPLETVNNLWEKF